MSKWSAIHPLVHIKSKDGFRMVLFPMPEKRFFQKLGAALSNKPEPEDEFMRKLIPDGPLPRSRLSAMKMYVSRVATSTYCVGRSGSPAGEAYLIGFREEKDIFKILLIWPDAKQVNSWRSNTNFFVRVAEGDEYEPVEGDPTKIDPDDPNIHYEVL